MCPHPTIYVSSSYLYLGGEVVETLATRGALLQAKDTKGYCALHIAAESGNLEAIQVLTACSRMLTYAHVCSRMLTLLCAAHSSGEWQSRGHPGPYRMLTHAHACSRMLTYAHVCSRYCALHTAAECGNLEAIQVLTRR
jgi:hypothetical protein